MPQVSKWEIALAFSVGFAGLSIALLSMVCLMGIP